MGDVLERLFAQVLSRNVELAAGLGEHGVRDTDPAWLGHRFEPSGDVDPVAEYVAVLDEDVAKIDTDAEHDPLILRRCPIAFGHRPLDRDRAGNGLNNARKLDQHAIASSFDDTAPMLGDFRIDEFAAMCSKPG